MSGSAGIYLEQAILGHTLGFAPMPAVTTVYVALCLAGPAAAPTEVVHGIEVTGLGYARVLAPFALAASHANLAANVSSVEYDDAGAAWGNIGYFELWDNATGGNRLYWGQIIDPNTGVAQAITVAAGDIVRFSSGALAVQAATGTATPTGTVGAYLPLAGGVLTGALTLAADPVAGTTGALQAATRQYVDAHSGSGGGAGFLPLSGGTLIGALTLVGDAASALQPVTLQQLNAANVAAGTTYLKLTGGTVTGAVTVGAELDTTVLRTWAASPGANAGSYLMWNRVSGDGSTYLINNPTGGNTGGIYLIETDGTTDHMILWASQSGTTSYVPIAVTGTLTVSGAVTFSSTLSAGTTFLGHATVSGALWQGSQNFSGNNIDVSAAAVFTRTISAATTFTLSNVPGGGTVTSFILELTNGGSAAITWWAGLTWAGGVVPVLSASGVDVLGFYTPNGGSSWRGLLLGKAMA